MRFNETLMFAVLKQTTRTIESYNWYSLVLISPFLLAVFCMGVIIALAVDPVMAISHLGDEK